MSSETFDSLTYQAAVIMAGNSSVRVGTTGRIAVDTSASVPGTLSNEDSILCIANMKNSSRSGINTMRRAVISH